MNIKLAEKVFRSLFIFAFVLGMIGVLTTSAGAQQTNPTFNVVANSTNRYGRMDWVEGMGWAIGEPRKQI